MSVEVKKGNVTGRKRVLCCSPETERIFYVAVKIYKREHVGVACSFLICLYGNSNKVSEA